MGWSTGTAKLLLPALAIVGFLGTHKLAMDNGLYKMIAVNLKSSSPQLEGTNFSQRTQWTGFKAIDSHLSLMVSFFWPMLSGNIPNLTLMSTHFLGQGMSIWMLMLIETFRVGNTWRLVSFATLTGLLIENVAAAIIIPLWCTIHLFTSPIALAPGSSSRAQAKTSLLVHPTELKVLPWSLLIGAGIPTALMVFSSAATVEPLYKSQQFWIVARFAHPLLTSATHLIISMFCHSSDASFMSAEQRNKGVLRALEHVYSIATYVAVVPHVAVFSIALLSQLAPAVFANGYQSLFSPTRIFWPVSLWTGVNPSKISIGSGSLMFLQWDEIVSCAAILIWAFALNRQALSREPQGSTSLGIVVRTCILTLVGGPAAAAISLIRERDTVILESSSEVEEKKSL